MKPAVVALGECRSYDDDLVGMLDALWTLAEMPDARGRRVLIKPNLVDWLPSVPASTAAPVVAALVDVLRAHGAQGIAVGDGPAFRRDAMAVAEAAGLRALLAARGVAFVDLNDDQPVQIPAPAQWFSGVETLWLPRTVCEADLLVSAPKLKTHHWAGVSLSLKNLLGLLPGGCYGWPKNFIHVNGITRTIVGLVEMLPPVVAVLDGIVGMEGDGPIHGRPVAHGVLAVGNTALALDWIGAQLMGYSIAEVDHLMTALLAAPRVLAQVEVRGADLERLRRLYERAPNLSPALSTLEWGA